MCHIVADLDFGQDFFGTLWHNCPMPSVWESLARAIASGASGVAEDVLDVEGSDGEWENVSSSHIDQVMYSGGTIGVRFRNGDVHYYPGESRALYEELRDSGSPGAVYWANLRVSRSR